MDELELNELFGLETADNGEDEQDVADPAAEESEESEAEGEEAQESADPASVDDGESADARRGTTEEDSRYAAARRRAEAERDAYVARARQEERERANSLIKSLGVSNPMQSGSKFETLEDIEKYRGELQERRLQQGLRNGTASREDLAQSVLQSEAMRPIVAMQREIAAQRAAESRRTVESRLDQDVAEIGKIDPDIKSRDDLFQLKEFPTILEHVRRGESLPDAYRFVFLDKLTGRRAQAEVTAARNRAAGKRHLAATTTRGSGGVEVDRDTVEEYRKYLPEVSEREIREYEAKYRKTKK